MFCDMMPDSLKRIAVILEGRVQYERNVLRGIREFAALKENWLLRLEMPGSRTAARIENWKPDGVLFQSAGLTRAAVEKVSRMKNSIHLSEPPAGAIWNSVGLDNAEIGRAAAAYFFERRLQHFAFVGSKGVGFSKTRKASFQTAVKGAGGSVQVVEFGEKIVESEIIKWLRNLPKPCGLFATHDECSLMLTTMCRGEGIRVPEEIAILGVDNDTLICELALPQLSSVSVPSKRVGFAAAEMLAQKLKRKSPGKRSVLLPPTGVVTRQSTDVFQTEDDVVNRALRFMHGNVNRRINVEDVLREIGSSRRFLERKFMHQLGRSPLQEIQHSRMELAKRLLIETRQPLREIAIQCGCGDASRMVTMFRRECGMTPGEFRKVKTNSTIQ